MGASAGRAGRLIAGSEATEAPTPPPPADAEPPPSVALEFELPAEAAARLPRLPALRPHRLGRARGGTADRVWLDSADGRLAAQGLVVEAPTRGPRRLLRILPPAEALWHPGQPPEILRSLTAGEALAEAGEAPLTPIAAFIGRQHAIRLAVPGGEVEALLTEGRLRSLAEERPAATLRLSGPAGAVLDAARMLAASLPIRPVLSALAEQGRALAAAVPPRPFRLGPADTSAATTVEDAFLRAAGHLLEVAAQQSARIAPGAPPEPVHQTRVALRRLRSVFRVFRAATDCAALRAFDAGLREALTVLGPARDWDVFQTGIAREIADAFDEDPRIASLRRAAEARRAEAYEAVAAMLAGPAWRLLAIEGIGILLLRPWREGAEEERLAMLDAPAAPFGRAVLDRRWQRLRRAGAGFDELSAEQLHELRLDGKRLRYAAEVFAPLFGQRATRRFLRRVSALQEGLGLANDAAVARGLARSLAAPGHAGRAWAVGAAEGWSEARLAARRGAAHEAWEKLQGKDRFWTGD
ncbi:CHAD domain-containing protein [Roseomonas sp. PWR1]|uniref:CHAD domain-containing protein n=1 Tax=Roseomonas nitratireducens TaxID=2820810 RepID=A0ABS4AYN0_9PROT|nr:CHAD domain-containing protein [Neoroseomonas nitratireducens]MBP0466485.1 CHAD domain-containing protein [Neoroseomonas nitratireducens]